MKGDNARRVAIPSWRYVIVAVVLATVLAAGLAARRRSAATPGEGMPPSRPAEGIVYDGLRRDPGGACRGSFEIGASDRCTHGPDPAPDGIDISGSADPVAEPARPAAVAAQCDGDGISGPRTEVLYVRASDRPDRFESYLPSFRAWAGDSSGIYRQSAAKTGGVRNVRFVHDAACTITVGNVVVPPGGNDDVNQTIAHLKQRGFDRVDRKYMLFVEANVYCGIGDIAADDQPGPANASNSGPSFGRTDAACWSAHAVAHEHMHNLGGVQLSAPNASGGHHCVDDNDVMCYRDQQARPAMKSVCRDAADEELFDCNNDDYFSANPAPGSYLATRWNAANSQFLFSSASGIPTIRVGDVSVTEPTTGVRAATFTLSLSSAAASDITVAVSTADGTAVAPSDYAATSGRLTFPAGTTSHTFEVGINGDLVDEPDETFSVNLADPIGATTVDRQGTGTVVNQPAEARGGGGVTSVDS